ncbi:MAG: hypothetical protein LBU76_03500 [Azoarcus sp.]|jgi:hypothetical protein|nr:hypothetical protein [Azoarcus sp.]
MKVSEDWDFFIKTLDRVVPKLNKITPPSFEEQSASHDGSIQKLNMPV